MSELDLQLPSVIISKKHKVIGVPLAPAVENLFPNMQRMDGMLLVPHQPSETDMLRKLGYEVPSPIISNYDFPHPLGEPPFDAQIKTSSLLTLNKRAYVLNSMGTGKTRAALWAWDYLNTNKLAGKLLVIAPLSTLRFTWGREIFTTLPGRKYVIVYGSRTKRLEILNDKEADIFIINHDGVKTVINELQARRDIDTLVIDELAVYRNGQSQRNRMMRQYAASFNWVWGMTGAPIPNSPTDAWGQVQIITPHKVPRYFKGFREALMNRVSQFTWVPKPDAVEKAFLAMQPAVRFTLEDVVELPEAIYRTVDIELGLTQSKIYKQIAAHCYAAVQSGEITAANAGAAFSKLLQISTGYVYASDGSVVNLDNEDRLKALTDTIMSTTGKKLVFVPFKHALKGIADALKNENIDFARMSGDTPMNERGEIFNIFQNTDKYQVLAAHPQCLAHGITLTRADTVIWFSPVTSLEIYEQANARISRVGQKAKQLFLHFQGTPVERRIYKLLQNKQSVQGELLNLFEVATQNILP